MKISIPEELKVIGYDGTKLIKRIAPQLSTIVQPIDEMCDVMIDLLLRRMKDPDVALEENYPIPIQLSLSESQLKDTFSGVFLFLIPHLPIFLNSKVQRLNNTTT